MADQITAALRLGDETGRLLWHAGEMTFNGADAIREILSQLFVPGSHATYSTRRGAYLGFSIRDPIQVLDALEYARHFALRSEVEAQVAELGQPVAAAGVPDDPEQAARAAGSPYERQWEIVDAD